MNFFSRESEVEAILENNVSKSLSHYGHMDIHSKN